MDALREGTSEALVSEREGYAEQGLEHDPSEGKPAKDSAPCVTSMNKSLHRDLNMSQSKQSRLKVYNTLTRHLDDFEPLHPGRVNLFVCGPTVYDLSHIGHGKSYVAYDIIARYLRKKGYAVFFLLNITDIDDKIINRAKETKEDPLKLSERYAQAFYKDMKDLHVN